MRFPEFAARVSGKRGTGWRKYFRINRISDDSRGAARNTIEFFRFTPCILRDINEAIRTDRIAHKEIYDEFKFYAMRVQRFRERIVNLDHSLRFRKHATHARDEKAKFRADEQHDIGPGFPAKSAERRAECERC